MSFLARVMSGARGGWESRGTIGAARPSASAGAGGTLQAPAVENANGARALERAKLEEARAKEAEDRARREAGLVRKLDQLDVARAALENATQAALARAQAARLQAESLGRVAPAAAMDSDVRLALEQAAGAPQSAPTLEDRLSAARARSGSVEEVRAITDARAVPNW